MDLLSLSLLVCAIFVLMGVVWYFSTKRQPQEKQDPAIQLDSALQETTQLPLDDLIDYCAHFKLAMPLSAIDLHSAMDASKKLGKTVTWQGMSEDGRWQVLSKRAYTACRELKVGFQLADRQGPVTEAMLVRFRDAMRFFAEQWEAILDLPSMEEYLETAQVLDAFSAEVDIMVAVNVVNPAGKPFAGRDVAELAAEYQLELHQGVLHYYRPHSMRRASMFTVSSHDGVAMAQPSWERSSCFGLSFVFEIPKALDGIAEFEQMYAMAEAFSERLGAKLVNDEMRSLTPQSVDAIKQQLQQIYQDMQDRGIQPGSAMTLRLFS